VGWSAFELFLSAGLNALFGLVPFLGLPIVRQIVTALVMSFGKKLFELNERNGNRIEIRFKAIEDQLAFDEATLQLLNAEKDPNVSDEEYERIKQVARDKASHFFRLAH